MDPTGEKALEGDPEISATKFWKWKWFWIWCEAIRLGIKRSVWFGRSFSYLMQHLALTGWMDNDHDHDDDDDDDDVFDSVVN